MFNFFFCYLLDNWDYLEMCLICLFIVNFEDLELFCLIYIFIFVVVNIREGMWMLSIVIIFVGI